MNEFPLRLLINAAWQVPLIAAMCWCITRPLRRWPASWSVAAWRAAWILAIAVPLATSTWTLPAAVAEPFRILATSTPLLTGIPASQSGSAVTPWLFVLYAAFVAMRAMSLFLAWRRLRDLDESAITVPLTFGFRYPRILFPTRFRTHAPEDAQRAAMAHEQAHIEHRDYLFQLLLEAATIPVSFHPVFLWIRRRTLEAVEMRCDETAAITAFAGDFRTYAAALLEAARVLGPELPRVPRLAATFHTNNTFEDRILNLMQIKLIPNKWRGAAAVLTLCLAGTFAVGLSATIAAAQQATEKAYRVGEDGVTSPKLTTRIEPKYPSVPEDQKIEGTVVLSLEINKDGTAENIRIVRTLAPLFDESAIDALKQWKFEPGKRNGEAVRVKATVEVNFRRV